MRKKVGILKRMSYLLLIFLLSINSFAAIVSDNDGSAFITKAEFDALKSSFQSQIDTYNQSIDAKIDGAIAAYLSGIKISTKQTIDLAYSSLGNQDIKWIRFRSGESVYETWTNTMWTLSFTQIDNSSGGTWLGYVSNCMCSNHSRPTSASSGCTAYAYYPGSNNWYGSHGTPAYNPVKPETFWPQGYIVEGSKYKLSGTSYVVKTGAEEVDYTVTGYYIYRPQYITKGDTAWGNEMKHFEYWQGKLQGSATYSYVHFAENASGTIDWQKPAMTTRVEDLVRKDNLTLCCSAGKVSSTTQERVFYGDDINLLMEQDTNLKIADIYWKGKGKGTAYGSVGNSNSSIYGSSATDRGFPALNATGEGTTNGNKYALYGCDQTYMYGITQTKKYLSDLHTSIKNLNGDKMKLYEGVPFNRFNQSGSLKFSIKVNADNLASATGAKPNKIKICWNNDTFDNNDSLPACTDFTINKYGTTSLNTNVLEIPDTDFGTAKDIEAHVNNGNFYVRVIMYDAGGNIISTYGPSCNLEFSQAEFVQDS